MEGLECAEAIIPPRPPSAVQPVGRGVPDFPAEFPRQLLIKLAPLYLAIDIEVRNGIGLIAIGTLLDIRWRISSPYDGTPALRCAAYRATLAAIFARVSGDITRPTQAFPATAA